MTLLLGLAATVLCTVPAPAAEVTFYVSNAGNDAWSGTVDAPNAGATDGPFASLARARDAIRELKAAGPLPGPVTVLIRGGRYFIEQPLTLGPEDSGTEQCPVAWAACPGETPELIGGRQIAN
ncbi:MAG TPA: right-handed parallel beta-helix repeat-containing protein, partial [Actinomycetes bacterium]|nr:right-handed parallel beta-helix repeat-containing protein [Actinomycetes bacterium]